MSQRTFQILLGLIGCALYLTVIYSLTKKQRLTFRYAVGWLSMGILGVISLTIIPFADAISRFLKVSPAVIVSIGAVSFLLMITIQLSISISGLQHQLQRLAEEIALVKSENEN